MIVDPRGFFFALPETNSHLDAPEKLPNTPKGNDRNTFPTIHFQGGKLLNFRECSMSPSSRYLWRWWFSFKRFVHFPASHVIVDPRGISPAIKHPFFLRSQIPSINQWVHWNHQGRLPWSVQIAIPYAVAPPRRPPGGRISKREWRIPNGRK